MEVRWRIDLQAVLLLTTGGLLCLVLSQCDVRVPDESPWPRMVYVPQNASVYIDCTTDSNNPFWSIDLAEDGLDTALVFFLRGEKLNSQGLYQLPRIETPGMPPTLRLLINNTAVNNQTVIQCVGDSITNETVIYLYEPTTLIIQGEEVGNTEQSINISWIIPNKSNRLYNLTVVNSDNQQLTFTLQYPYHIFTAPEAASPCEVYNFSVTATYDVVGATYTGAGCGEPSPVLSRMLPSLPIIGDLESSYNYSLEKLTGEVVLTVYFQPASFCADYPVTNYSLEVTQVGVDTSGMQFTSLENFIEAENLSEDTVYVFKLSATNSVGTVSTNLSQEIYTTDVQAVRVVATRDNNQIRVECDFILGSDADGCVVVLVSSGEVDNTTLNITREDNTSSMVVAEFELPSRLYCYRLAYALDVESDGSIGSLPVPGVLELADINTDESCLPTDIFQPQSEPRWVIGVGIAVILLLLAVTLAVIVISIVVIKRVHPKYKKSSGRFSIVSTYSFENSTPSPNTFNSTPIYAVVDKSKKSKRRSSGDGAENHKITSELIISTELDAEGVTGVRVIQPTNEADGPNADIFPSQGNSEPPPDYGDVCEQQRSQEMPDESNEHIIEGFTPVHLLGPSVTPPPKVDPTYQEVVELSDTNSAPTSHVELVTSSTPPLPVHSTSDSAPIPGPIYHEVGELPQRRTPVHETNNQDSSVIEAHNENDSEVRLTPVQASTSDSTGTATHPLYQEVPNIIQRGMQTDSNKIADNNDLIELSDMRDMPTIGDDIEDVDNKFVPPQLVGASPGPFGGIHPDRLYDEVTERPRVISPANFAEATDISPEPNSCASPFQNSTPPPPNSSPLPTYATVTPRSARSRGTGDELEQQPEPQNDLPEFVHTSHAQNFTPPPSSSSPIQPYATVTPPSTRSRRTVDQPSEIDNDSPKVSHTSCAQDSTPPLPDSSTITPYATVTPPSVRSRKTVDIFDQPPQIDNDSPQEWYTSRAQSSTPPPPGSSTIPPYATVTPRSARHRGTAEQSPNVDHSRDNSPEPVHASRIQNSTPPPPDSSPLPAYAAVAPHSARSRGTEDVVEQPPKLELASPGFQPYPLFAQYNSADSRYLPSGDDFLDEWDDYKIPPGGTLV